MLKKLSVLALLPLFFYACKNENGYQATETGLKYKFFVDSAGAPATLGEAVKMDVKIWDERDSLLEHSVKTSAKVTTPKFKGGLEEGFMMMSPGDSASFKINADSFFLVNLNRERPDFLSEGSELTFNLKLHKIYSREEVAAEMEKYHQQLEAEKQNKILQVENFMDALLDSASIQKQMKVDERIMKEFMKDNNLDMEKSKHGVYYTISERAGNAKAEPGDTLVVHYTGRLLDGKVFDTSEGRAPFDFVLGIGEVIPGWDDVITYFGEGDKGQILIPSSLAYMDIGIPDPSDHDKFLIPKNAPLIFDVEILEVRK
ncbi:FKBP-type peptidyl-prolyl cis-trans isomerase [Cytophagaceae bacterium ABcell3]|nr:FKBP-type peptidyl-prolyl cis-trans isomerase [Cytophagaceae bacterium ABcell3]